MIMKRALLFLLLLMAELCFGAPPIYLPATNGLGSQSMDFRNIPRTRSGFLFTYDGTTNASGFLGNAPLTIFTQGHAVSGTNNWVVGGAANTITNTRGSGIFGSSSCFIDDAVSTGSGNFGNAIIGSQGCGISGGFNNVILNAQNSFMRGVISVSLLSGEDSIMDFGCDIAGIYGGERNYMTNSQGGQLFGTGLGLTNENYVAIFGYESNYFRIDQEGTKWYNNHVLQNTVLWNGDTIVNGNQNFFGTMNNFGDALFTTSGSAFPIALANGNVNPACGYYEGTFPTGTSFTLTATNGIVIATANMTVTFPTAVGIRGRKYTIKSASGVTTTLATTSSQTIDGSAPGTVTSLQARRYVSDGVNWWIIGN